MFVSEALQYETLPFNILNHSLKAQYLRSLAASLLTGGMMSKVKKKMIIIM